MAELTPGMLLQQQELLREIRDELRSTRAASTSSAPPGSGVGGMPSRPSSSFITAQATMDRMLAGEWGSLGWSGAYAPVFKSGITQDILSSMGLIRAPNTLTQLEYQMMSHDMLGARMAGMATNVIAPGFGGRSRGMAETIYANAGRFARFGDAGTGPLGSGIGYGTAFEVARSLQMGAATDLRMSGKDYNTVMSTGMNTGQFDFASSVSDLKDRFTELKNAVSDLSRTTRMSTEEVAKSMGALRQYGVYDIADQKRMVSQMGTTAAVAGLSMGEVSGAVQTAMQRGLQLGIGPQAGFQLAQTNIAAMRTMTRGGIVSDAVRAMGGGVGAIAENITSAQQNFMASDIGYLATQGGGGDFLGAMGRGLGQNGSLGGFLGNRARRMDRMSQVSGDEAGALMDSFIDTQMRLSGMSDYDSDAGQGGLMTFAGQMGMSDPAALSYARGRSRRGVRSGLTTRLNTAMALRQQAQNLAMDDAFMQESFVGRTQHGLATVRGWAAGAADWATGFVSPGAAGAWGMSGSYEDTRRAIRGGTTSSVLSPELIAEAGLGSQASRTLAYTQGFGLRGAAVTLGGLAGGALGMGKGAMWGAALGSMVLPGIGSAIGGVVGGIAGGLAGYNAGQMAVTGTANLAGWAVGGSPSNLAADEASKYLSISDALSGAKAGTPGAESLATRLASNPKFQGLINLAAKGDLDEADTTKFVSDMASVAADNQVTQDQVAAALKTVGATPNLRSVYQAGMWGSTDVGAANTELISGLSSEGGRSLATPEGSRASAAYIRATRSGDVAGQMTARAALVRQGVSGKDITRLTENIGGMGDTADALASSLSDQSRADARSEINRKLGGLGDVIGGLVGGNAEAKTALEKFGGNTSAMLAALSGGGSGAAVILSALRGQGDQGKFLADLATVSGTESSDEIARKFLGGDTRKADAMLKGAKGDRTVLATMLGMDLFQAPTEDKEAKNATMVKDAANILRKLAKDMGVSDGAQ